MPLLYRDAVGTRSIPLLWKGALVAGAILASTACGTNPVIPEEVVATESSTLVAVAATPGPTPAPVDDVDMDMTAFMPGSDDGEEDVAADATLSPGPITSDECITTDWNRISTASVSVLAPSDLSDSQPQGIDSEVGQFESDDFSIEWDYGWYSNPLDNVDATEERSIVVDGYEARQIWFPSAARSKSIGIHIPRVAGEEPAVDKLTITVSYDRDSDRGVAECILSTVSLTADSPDVPDVGARLCVVGISSPDILNIRRGPGTSNPVVGELSSLSCSIHQLGPPQSGWIPVLARSATVQVQGWVSSNFVASADAFGRAEAVTLTSLDKQYAGTQLIVVPDLERSKSEPPRGGPAGCWLDPQGRTWCAAAVLDGDGRIIERTLVSLISIEGGYEIAFATTTAE